jgi:hypothetical protein
MWHASLRTNDGWKTCLWKGKRKMMLEKINPQKHFYQHWRAIDTEEMPHQVLCQWWHVGWPL